ncbi:pyrroloquinoline quinone biosynthesis protein PqqB [marine bacterium AO1-C]|nr:pyrroloquinoline quinone biosynthesis protein PqqB [marine bacterium AO1-C]
MHHSFIFTLLICLSIACQPNSEQTKSILSDSSEVTLPQVKDINTKQYLIVLGIAQDAGYPQAGCTKKCCTHVWNHPEDQKRVVSLGIVDQTTDKKWMIEATPDFKEQMQLLNTYLPSASMLPNGILLTHGHIGHYTGLMHLGREVMGAKNLPVFAMPRMQAFLSNNGPWSQLVKLQNIALQPIQSDSMFHLSPNIKVIPLQVPHRDEFTETVGYKIIGKAKTALFIPDIDKWKKWKVDLKMLLKEIDIALLDGSFYKNGEIPNRDMSQIPHPFVEESMNLLQDLPKSERAKVYFIHFNHTNPLIQAKSPERQEVLEKGYKIAKEGQIISLD